MAGIELPGAFKRESGVIRQAKFTVTEPLVEGGAVKMIDRIDLADFGETFNG